MNRTRITGIAAVVLMVVLCMGAQLLHHSWHAKDVKNAYVEPLTPAPAEEDPTGNIVKEDAYRVEESFTTHLPLVILDLPEGEPQIVVEEGEDHVYYHIEGLDPYVNGEFHLINNPDGINRVTDTPEVSSNMIMRRRGYSSAWYEKGQWMVKLRTESGQDNDQDILGMGQEHEWILNGSLQDKSMLRNYLAYSIASEIMPYTPDFQFCEVLLREDGVLRYQGVFLIGENIKIGEDRVAIQEYKPDNIVNSYIVRRERYDDIGINLNTYGQQNGYEGDRYVGLIAPSKNKVTGDMISYVEKDISNVDKTLYSDNDSVFATYPDIIDVDSFVDYFLVNEFFTSYDAGTNSTYAYKDFGGKLCMGPVWDYDGTMDNYWKEPASPKDIAFQEKTWFNALCTDKAFCEKLLSRYTKLRRGPLSDQHITEKINEIVAHIGGAQQREWLRWGNWYTSISEKPHIGLADFEKEDGTILHRNAETYEDELYRIQTVIHDHAEAMPDALRALAVTAERDTAGNDWNGWLLLLTACIFFGPAIYVSFFK